MICLIDAPEFKRLRRIKQLGLGLYNFTREPSIHASRTALGGLHLTRVRVAIEIPRHIVWPTSKFRRPRSQPGICKPRKRRWGTCWI